ncbi:MAG: hybrid sensor histidine kinase/response regulator, partial [Rubrivivax sp.]
MNMLHDIHDDDSAVDDLSTVAWVHEELRRSLELAHKSLRRYLKEADAVAGSDVDAVDPAVLRAARAQLHQGVGALEMIGLPGPARVLRASEAVVQRFIAKPKSVNRAAIEAIESTSFGVLDYLSRKLAGKGLPTLALFPQYRVLQELAGADRVHPADLWREDWQWRHVPGDARAEPHPADAAARTAMETQVLAIMRGADRGAMQRLSDLCAGLGAASAGDLAGLWKLAAAFYEAQAVGLMQPDVYAKRVSSRLLAQLRLALAGQTEVSQRLAQDVLFFCAHARMPGESQSAPRLEAVREAYDLDGAAAFDYQAVRLGRFDPAWIAQARKRVAGAKEVWSAVAGGELHRLNGLAEQFALVGDSLKRLYPSGEQLAESLQAAVAQTVAGGKTPGTGLAMEVATGVLYLEASLEDGEFDQPLIGTRVQRLAQRIRHVGDGRGAQPLEPWMEELYRRVSDRQTMGSVVQELRSALSDVEKQIDQFFRDPAQRELLIPVPGQLRAM